MPRLSITWLAICLAGAWVSMGCAHVPRPCDNPPPIYVTFQGSSQLNPDEKGQPLVTQVLVLQTRGTAKVESADFNDLRAKPQEVLGDELISVNDTTVEPNGSTTIGYRRDPKATALVVMGVFRQPTSNTWRAIATLPPANPDRCTDQPQPAKDAPGKDDTVLIFGLDGYRVVNRTPPPKS
jgi:type VI secretion system protein VasD